MTFWEAEKFKKPDDPGEFDFSRVDPKWWWFWDNPNLVAPCWTGVGDVRDLTTNNFRGVLTNGAVWSLTQAGLGVFNAQVTGQRIDFGSHAALQLDRFTHFGVFRIRDASTSASLVNTKWGPFTSSGYNIVAGSDGSLGSARHNAATIQNIGAGVISVGKVHAFASTYDKATGVHRFVVDGIDYGTVTVIEAIVHDVFALGSYRSADSTNSDDVDILAYAVWPDHKSLSQLLQLTCDPFGPLSMVDEIPLFVPEAVAGGRIMSSLAHHGGLAGPGGIAGVGGGLAG